MQREKVDKLEEGLQEVKKLAKEFKKRNGNGSTHILNKDILFLLLTKSMDADKRIARLEGILKVLIPIVLAGIGLNITGII